MKGYITAGQQYKTELEIPCFQVDANKRLKVAAFMDLAQEMAYLAAEAMGFGYSSLSTLGRAWVLSRMHIRFDRLPFWGDTVDLRTWHKGACGPFYLRDFSLDSPEGESLVRATSSWVVLDTASRHMVRGDEVMKMVPEDTVCPLHGIEEPAPKVAFPRGAEVTEAGLLRIKYSDVDLLGHTNNVCYVLHALDCLDPSVLLEARLSDLFVTYNHETRLGQELQLQLCRDGNDIYVQGLSEGAPAFCLKVVLKNA